MKATWFLVIGVGFLVCARILLRSFREGIWKTFPEGHRGRRNLLVLWVAMVAVTVSGASITTYALTETRWVASLFLQEPSQQVPATAALSAAIIAASSDDNQPVLQPTQDANGARPSQESAPPRQNSDSAIGEPAAEPADGNTIALILTALGIVMTLVTAIVISISRSAIEDIRRVESQVSPVLLEKIGRLDEELRIMVRRREILETRVALALKFARIGAINRDKIRVDESNKQAASEAIGQALARRIETRKGLKNIFNPHDLDPSHLERLIKTLNVNKSALHGDLDEEIEFLREVSNYLLLLARDKEASNPDARDAQHCRSLADDARTLAASMSNGSY